MNKSRYFEDEFASDHLKNILQNNTKWFEVS